MTAETKTLEPKALAARMGISPKRLRAMLRADRPRAGELKGKKWEINLELAKTIEREYKEKKAKAQAEKQAQIKAELEGKA